MRESEEWMKIDGQVERDSVAEEGEWMERISRVRREC